MHYTLHKYLSMNIDNNILFVGEALHKLYHGLKRLTQLPQVAVKNLQIVIVVLQIKLNNVIINI